MTHQKHRSTLVFMLPLLLAVVSLGCGLSDITGESAANSGPLPTRTPMPTFTPTPQGASFVEVAVTTDAQQDNAAQPVSAQAQAESPTPTPLPVEEAPAEEPTPAPPTETPTPAVPSATVLQNMNVRSGPGTGYAVVGAGAAGDNSQIVGRNSDSSWVQVQYPSNSGTGWLYAPLVEIQGDLNQIPIVQVAPPPPPPTPTPEPQPEAPPPPPEPQYQFTPTGWHASENAAIVHFKGRLRDEAGNLVNGYSVLVDNWSWSVISHPSGASHHYPEKGDGEWDVVIPATDIGNGVGWWYLTVVSYDCPDFFARFDAQCKQFTRLSEDIPIMVNWPDETIINADWTCHWDCNKGLYVDGFKR